MNVPGSSVRTDKLQRSFLLAFLEKRGLDLDTIRRFRLGFAPDRRTALKQALGKTIPEPLLVEAGLVRKPTSDSAEEGRESFDYFRGRVIFPIADRGGRIIAFGGRTLGDGQPKYLNSPETPLFQKGRVRRTLKGRAYEYRPVASKESVLGQAVGDLIRRMFGGSSEELVMSLVKTRQIDPETLARLSRRIEGSEEGGPE